MARRTCELIEEREFKNIDELINYQYTLKDKETRGTEYYFLVNRTIITKNFFLEVYKIKY